MSLFALIALGAAAPAVSPEQRAAVDRFVAACVRAQLRPSELRRIDRRALPSSLQRRYRDIPEGRYFRVPAQRPSYLLVLRDNRPGAEYHSVCALASRAGSPWQLYQGVMDTIYPEDASRGRTPDVSDGITTTGAATINPEQGWTIEANRVGAYTLLETLRYRPKGSPPAGTRAPADPAGAAPDQLRESDVDPR